MSKYKLKIKKIALLGIVGLLLSCGGGSSNPPASPVNTSTGIFLDSPVINIGYRTETLEGVTNSLGEYEYLPGENVTFFIGDLNFPAVAATGTVTPLDLAGTQDAANSKVMNMIRLLQTLDQDGDPSNGITIADQANSSATQVDFNLSESNFAASSAVMNLILNAGLAAPVTELVSAADALAHFQKELIESGILTKVLADNFDSGALATGVWEQSLDGANRSIQGGRLVNTVTGNGSLASVHTSFIRGLGYTYIETTVRISSDSVISEGARGKVRLAGRFYNDRRGPGSGLLHNGYEGDVWGDVTVELLDDRTLVAKASLGPEDADGSIYIDTFLDQTFSTSVQFDTDYVMSMEQTADDRFILTFNGESFTYQETGPMYPLSEQPYQGLNARIYAGGTGGTLLVEWDDVYVAATMPQNERPTMATRYFPLAIGDIWQDFHSNNVDSFTEYTYRNTNKFAITNSAAVYNIKNDISSPNLENENSFYSKWDDGIYYHGIFDADADDQGFSIALTYTPPVLFLKSTFNINDTWSNTTDVFLAVDGNTVDTIPVAFNFLVMAIEDVTVPAGTFQNCYKISIEVSSSNPDLNEAITIWLAEDVGVVKKVSSTIDSISTQELQYSNVGGIVHGLEVIN